MLAPVTYPASGPARYATIPAISSPCPYRPTASSPFSVSAKGPSAGFISVSTGPGCTLLTVICRGPKSRANPFVKPTIAAFVAFLHLPRGLLCRHKHAAHIYRDANLRNPRVVHQNVDAAKLVNRRLHCVPHFLRIRRVGSDTDRLAPIRDDRIHNLLRPLPGTAVGDRHLGALFGQPLSEAIRRSLMLSYL